LGLKVLSLFDGMSCGRLALDRLGIKVDKYYASEIDKYAIQVAQANYPDTIHIGDVCDIKAEDYQDIDLILAGSPCQGFSFAGKQLAFDDPRSALFFEFVRLLKEIKPKYFLLENVKMKKEFLDVISEQVSACYPDFEGGDMFGGKIEPILINSALVSAQNRQRYYWTNISGVEQPEQRGIVLRDILENGFDSERDKSYCLDANYYKGSSVENYFKKSRRQMVYQDETHDTPKQVGTAEDINGHDILKRVYSPDGKAPTLNTMGGGNREPKVVVDVRSMTEVRNDEANRIRAEHKKKTGKDWSPRSMRHLVEREDEKSNALTSALTKQHILKITEDVVVQSYREVRTDEAKRLRRESKQKTGKDHTPFRAKELIPREDGKVGTITPNLNNDHQISLSKDESSDVYWRKLTCVECERLQTVPDNYTNHVSNTQRYKMLGNGWTIEVIAHILKNIN
jgi:DNA-cytosine methyltransferase